MEVRTCMLWRHCLIECGIKHCYHRCKWHQISRATHQVYRIVKCDHCTLPLFSLHLAHHSQKKQIFLHKIANDVPLFDLIQAVTTITHRIVRASITTECLCESALLIFSFLHLPLISQTSAILSFHKFLLPEPPRIRIDQLEFQRRIYS